MLKTFELTPERRNHRTAFETLFTSICPFTGESNLAKITIEYLPNGLGLKMSSLETYFESFSGVRIGKEEIVNRILDDLIMASRARELIVRAHFTTQDGMKITIEADHPPGCADAGPHSMNSV